MIYGNILAVIIIGYLLVKSIKNKHDISGILVIFTCWVINVVLVIGHLIL